MELAQYPVYAHSKPSQPTLLYLFLDSYLLLTSGLVDVIVDVTMKGDPKELLQASHLESPEFFQIHLE